MARHNLFSYYQRQRLGFFSLLAFRADMHFYTLFWCRPSLFFRNQIFVLAIISISTLSSV
jgi:hypothetical protein